MGINKISTCVTCRNPFMATFHLTEDTPKQIDFNAIAEDRRPEFFWELMIKLNTFQETVEKTEQVFPVKVALKIRIGDVIHRVRHDDPSSMEKLQKALRKQMEREIQIPDQEMEDTSSETLGSEL